MHGFSIYLGQPIDKSYIRRMVDLGYKTIFTSVQIPEENDDTKYRYLGELLDFLSNDQLNFMIDINPSLLDHHFYEFLKQYDSAQFIIRIDHSTSIEIVNEIISNDFQCCLNASIISDHLLQHLYQHLNHFNYLCYCHNYYPRPDTGLEAQFVKSQNELILSYNPKANIYGFIAGTTLRGPLFKGLPTIETARYMHTIESAQLLQDLNTQHIMIGDPYLNRHNAQQLISFLEKRHFNLSITLLDTQAEDILLKSHTVRPDNPGTLIRSQEARHYCKADIQPLLVTERTLGAITLDNKLNGRYQGELQIIKKVLPPHKNVNVVAQIDTEDIPIINCMRPNDSFEFTINAKELKS
ncbi:MupG family TIM beta-alpha barrel fold protein [Staphylococcus xylosus]|uniref:DUF871 family protein n=1 Tax=Staphylococcus xylosus TaxID=1288 RepID=A0A5R9B038_STAXY|nr:MupG family TIM beta-alpha barrel fold protein [Staphylococcus xylosus]MBE6178939.1 DUF871 family protein [Staphylococcus xylosus]MBG3874423.1 DUF871 family protein [Staphylococcus xylosus]MBM6638414.1 DUF871 family protein [Staphylococcus xylosus]MDO5514699.1 MupG family TIM beta-alpha barrel fold protein [Staphylococcus xylosus]MDW8554480.1 MupG family TIM beta-alpha barrel fold protein [Staphylococcus xylosus]